MTNTKKGLGRKLWCILLALALVVTMMPLAGGTAYADSKTYLDENGTPQEIPNSASSVSESSGTADVTWGNENSTTWYYVSGSITINGRIEVSGDVHLILKDSCTLNAESGIHVGENDSITIYGQSANDNQGKLIATGTTFKDSDSAAGVVYSSAGIGGIGAIAYKNSKNPDTKTGTITINGGNIKANGGEQCAGIGSGFIGEGGTVEINGGTVTAKGGKEAAGIGGGSDAYGTWSVTIKGGTVNAEGGQADSKSSGGAGIGTGKKHHYDMSGQAYEKSVCKIVISGGNVVATGAVYDEYKAADIGNGESNDVKTTVKITGGTITASQIGNYTYKETVGNTAVIECLRGAVFTKSPAAYMPGDMYFEQTSDGNYTVDWKGARIDGISSVDSILLSVDGTEKTNKEYTYALHENSLYLRNADTGDITGRILATVNGKKYCGEYTDTDRGVTLTEYKAITGVSISPQTIKAGEKTELSVTVEPATMQANVKSVSYAITDKGETEASLSEDKYVSAKYGGTIKVKVTLEDFYGVTHSEECSVTVNFTKVTGISGDNAIPKETSPMTLTLPTEVIPAGATYSKIEWTSNASDVASIADGKVTFSKEGSATLTATVTDGLGKGVPFTKEYPVTVKTPNALDISLGDITFEKDGNNTKVSYTDATGEATLTLNKGQYVTITGTTEQYTVKVNGCEANIILDKCNVTSSSTKAFAAVDNATVHIVLADDSSNSFTSTKSNNAGIYVPSGTSLTIDGNGTITATGGSNGAGIGSVRYNAAGNIIINSGTITATGGEDAAGIGSGDEGDGGSVTINGGKVTATGGSNGAGIGSGSGRNAGTVNITGGVTIATGKHSGAGIGGGGSGTTIAGGSGGTISISGGTVIAVSDGNAFGAGIGAGGGNTNSLGASGGNITITGGTVTASSKYGAAIGGGRYGSGGTVTITGGNVKTVSNYGIGAGYGGSGGTLTDGKGNSVSKVTLTVAGAAEATELTAIEGSDYVTDDVHTLDTDKLYFYLPAGTEITSVTTKAAGKYICKDGNTFYKDHEYSGACDKACNHCGLQRTTSVAHDYNDNYICKNCGEYQPAELNNGIYEISNVGQLRWFVGLVNGTSTDGTVQNQSANGKLMENIDASSLATIGIGTESSPYKGTFDGNGKTLTIALNSESEHLAPFPYVDGATIKNLILDGKITCSEKFAASIVSKSTGATKIEKCMSKVEITFSPTNFSPELGGLVAQAGSGTLSIDNCAFTGKIEGGSLTGSGGFVGNSIGTTKISNSFISASFAETSSWSYTFAGGKNITVSNSYYLNKFYSYNETNGIQQTAEQFASGEVTWLLNGKSSEGVWKQTLATDTYPNFTGDTVYKTTPCVSYTNTDSGEKAHDFNENRICKNCGVGEAAKYNQEKRVYEISNAGNLYWFAELVNGTLSDGTTQNQSANAILTNDIDMSGVTKYTPIGTTGLYYSADGDDKGYSGTFDGNGYIIKNLSIQGSDKEELTYGIFGTLSGAVKKLGVENFAFTVGSKDCRAGGIAGQIISGGSVTGCYVKDSTISTSNKVAGGIAGCNYDGTIKSCYTYKVSITATRMGGIVGDNCGDGNSGDGSDRPGSITDCYTDAAVIESDSRKGSVSDSAAGISDFATGEIAYKLNGSGSDGTLIWYQTLTGDNVQVYPQFSGKTVYCSNNTYTNDAPVSIGGGGVAVPTVPSTDEVTSDKAAGTTTSDTEIKLEEKTSEDGSKETTANVTVSDKNQDKIIDEAKKNDSKEIILDISKDAVNESAGTNGSIGNAGNAGTGGDTDSGSNGNAGNSGDTASDTASNVTEVNVKLDKDFIESIIKDTDADLTIRTPFGDKTYTQEELKELVNATEGGTISLTVTKAEVEEAMQAEKLAKVKNLMGKITLTARSEKTAKKSIKVTLKMSKATSSAIGELKELGYAVKYKYYRSTKKTSKYVGKISKTTKTFTNTKGGERHEVLLQSKSTGIR